MLFNLLVGVSAQCTANTHYASGSDTTWLNKLVSSDADANCCTARATCANLAAGSCPDGMKGKTGVDATKCPTDAASCGGTREATTCCELDATKCGGHANPCGDAHYASGSDATWLKKDVSGDAIANCCTAKAVCANMTAGSCPAGMKAKTDADSTHCLMGAGSCAGTRTASTCCELDTTKCGGYLTPCPETHYASGVVTDTTWLNKLVNGDKNANCCIEKKTCTDMPSGACPAGMKPKTNAGTTKCTSDANSCAGTRAASTCCELDDTKCGGLATPCPETHYASGDDTTWLNKAVDSDANANCCTAKKTCGDMTASCPAGMKAKTGADATKCPSDAASCPGSRSASTCCELDNTKCGGFAPADAGTTTTASTDASKAPHSQPTIFAGLVSLAMVAAIGVA